MEGVGGGGAGGAAAGCRVRLQRACAGLHAVLLLCSVVPRAGPQPLHAGAGGGLEDSGRSQTEFNIFYSVPGVLSI